MPNFNPPTEHLKSTQFKPGETGNPHGVNRFWHPPLRLVRGETRTVTECKDAALKLLDDALRTYEKAIDDKGVDETYLSAVLKLLGGFNASLPKPGEKPTRPLEDMSAEELRQFINGKK